AVEEARMLAQQPVELGELGDDVLVAAPGEAAALVDVDLLTREPLDAAREAETAARAGERAESVSKQRPGAAAFGEAIVVVRLAVVDVQPDAPRLLDAVVEVAADVAPRIVLKELRVGPLHPALRDQRLGRVPRPAEPFEEKDGVRELGGDARG